ncbi:MULTISPECIES: DUF1616 domain-containing protein [Halococcus]|uniref:DUF1616 domain-containing protein n=1 Tax=Halococcus salifodinae DSM 8989 TaxID=1227456 RepID=M0N7E8_9EURY|nr:MULTISPECIES: DUF1616 domain-containing protein [Halococcus]EMA53034.1 hypothetical protein C450_09468 [Halococcus salifodinae DSM 8989]
MNDRLRQWLATARVGFASDLVGVVCVVVATVVAVAVPGIRETLLRVPLAFALVLFLPGYALVGALFPERHTDRNDDDAQPFGEGLRLSERVVLSAALSIAVVILVGFGLVLSPIGFTRAAVLFVLSGVSVGAAVIAAIRRGQLQAEHRYRNPFEIARTARGTSTETTAGTALSVLLVVSIVAVGGIVTYDAVTPPRTHSTDFFLLTPNGSGPPTNTNYPTTLTQGEGQPLVVGVRNREGQPVNYAVVVALQRVAKTNGNLTTPEQVQLDRFTLRAGSNETVRERRTVVPTVAGSNLRLTFMLYRDQPPAQPTTENAYREVHLFVNVTEQAGSHAELGHTGTEIELPTAQ